MTRRFRLAILVGTLVLGPTVSAQTSGDHPDAAISFATAVAWQSRIAAARPAQDEPLYVVMHSAKDCPYCTQWKRDSAGLGNAKAIVDARQHVRIFIIDRDSIRGAERKTERGEQETVGHA